MSLLRRLKNIDNRTKSSVYGWIRRAEQELQLCHISQMISSICILYRETEDYFGVYGEKIQLSKDKKSVIKPVDAEPGGLQLNYGSIVIASNSKAVCRWKLKIKQIDSSIS